MNGDSISNADRPILDQLEAHLARRDATPGAPATPEAPAAPARRPLSVVPPLPEEEPESPAPAAAAAAGTADEAASGAADPAADPAAELEPAPEDTIRDIASLAATLEAEPAAVLEAVMVPNALGLEVPLGEALESWRRGEETFEARRQELETTYQTRTTAALQESEREVARLAALSKVMLEELGADFQGVDWAALRHSDPDQYVRLSEARLRRKARIEEVFKALEGAGGQRSARMVEQSKARQQEEAVKLIRKRPEWAQKPGLMKQIVTENQDVMRELGFSEAEIAGVTDHRMIIGLHYAAQHLKTLRGAHAKTVDATRKKHLLRPSALRAGARQPAQAPGTEQRQARLQDFSKARDVKSAAALIETMLPAQR